MSLWFTTQKQEKIMLSLLPYGRVYRQAFLRGSYFNRVIQWLSATFLILINQFNNYFKGLFICESSHLLLHWMRVYNIPNDIFYLDLKNNRKDVFVLRYLMKECTLWNFRAIANIYGIDINIKLDVDVIKDARFPASFPRKFYSGKEKVSNKLIISMTSDEKRRFPFKLPFKLGSGRQVTKVKRIFKQIKQAQCKIIYRKLLPGEAFEKRINFCGNL